MLLQGRKQPDEHTSLGPTAQANVGHVPSFEHQPIAAAFRDIELPIRRFLRGTGR